MCVFFIFFFSSAKSRPTCCAACKTNTNELVLYWMKSPIMWMPSSRQNVRSRNYACIQLLFFSLFSSFFNPLSPLLFSTHFSLSSFVLLSHHRWYSNSVLVRCGCARELLETRSVERGGHACYPVEAWCCCLRTTGAGFEETRLQQRIAPKPFGTWYWAPVIHLPDTLLDRTIFTWCQSRCKTM